ncbi:hypothetical protein [Acetobacter ghanensis]|nr:hypothetical protein [Acetobacter ghanensis]NHO39451.1 hypothetical protein [Acetobacter ghanensis]GBQ46471.1 hypothetical protein AA18895_0774 [Acetobacter ghanensis DSM 18895]
MTPEAIAQQVQMQLHEIVEASGTRSGLKQAFASVARKTGLTDGQIKRLFYGEWSVIPAHIFLNVERLYRNHLEQMKARAEHQAALYRARTEEWDRKWGDYSSNGAHAIPAGVPGVHSTGPSISESLPTG